MEESARGTSGRILLWIQLKGDTAQNIQIKGKALSCGKNIFHANKASNLKAKISKKLDAAKKANGVVEEAKAEVKEEKKEEVKVEVVEEKPVAKKATAKKTTTTKKTTAKKEEKAE